MASDEEQEEWPTSVVLMEYVEQGSKEMSKAK